MMGNRWSRDVQGGEGAVVVVGVVAHDEARGPRWIEHDLLEIWNDLLAHQEEEGEEDPGVAGHGAFAGVVDLALLGPHLDEHHNGEDARVELQICRDQLRIGHAELIARIHVARQEHIATIRGKRQICHTMNPNERNVLARAAHLELDDGHARSADRDARRQATSYRDSHLSANRQSPIK